MPKSLVMYCLKPESLVLYGLGAGQHFPSKQCRTFLTLGAYTCLATEMAKTSLFERVFVGVPDGPHNPDPRTITQYARSAARRSCLKAESLALRGLEAKSLVLYCLKLKSVVLYRLKPKSLVLHNLEADSPGLYGLKRKSPALYGKNQCCMA